jgi:beta-galactosidase
MTTTKRKGLKYFLYSFLLLVAPGSQAQQTVRKIVRINEEWEFTKDPVDPLHSAAAHWQSVSLPHTWNIQDVMDDTPGYYRAACWYRKRLRIETDSRSREMSLNFEGANQETEIFVNGKKAGMHTGGYTGFTIPLNEFLLKDGSQNEVLVKVDNSFNRNIPPLSADFTFYGGLYRDVYLQQLPKTRFSGSGFDNKGIYIHTTGVSGEQASVQISLHLSNERSSARKIRLVTTVFDKDGKKIAVVNSVQSLAARSSKTVDQSIGAIKRPHLWSPADPYLYTAVCQIIDAATGKIEDEESNPLAFRWYRFDPDNGFFLNGKSCKLVGASRHQDFEGMGNALPDELAVKDIEWLKKMGGNFLRVAHYPQDPSVLDACDRLGILASVEIPIVNEITESDTFYSNCRHMLVEMIWQNYNHPSIIIWCYMNEIFLRAPFGNDKPRQKIYFQHVAALAKMLDSTARKEDPSRYTMIANHGDFNRYRDNGITDIPMLVGWNLYSGWYGGVLSDFPAFLDKHHKEIPGKPLLVTEYGADADPRIRSFRPVRFDKSVEYTTRFHQYYMDEMMKRPFVAAAVIWNLADFNSEGREETMPHINNKGLLTWDRIPKDPFYYYEAKLTSKPFVKITSSYWKIRSGMAGDNEMVCHQPLTVAANMETVQAWLDGKSLGEKKITNGLGDFDVPFHDGINTVMVSGRKDGVLMSDTISINFHLLAKDLRRKDILFSQLNILLGGDRYYIDTTNRQVWIPGQEYKEGSWGFIGGKPFRIKGNTRLPYGTDKNIKGTGDDPVYQTQQTGIEEFRMDVPDGHYEITLHFAELEGGVVKELAYNLSDTGRKEAVQERVFNVMVNDSMVLTNFNIGKEYGLATAGAKKMMIEALNGKGIRIVFVPVSGEAVLNAVEVKRRSTK